MSKRLVTVYDPSIEISEVSIHYEKSVKYGKVNQRKVRTEKLVSMSFFVEIDAKPGITHSMEIRRVHQAMIAKFGFHFPTLRRNANGTYTIAQTTKSTFVAILENGSRVSGENRDRLAKRAATFAAAQNTRVVEVARIALAA
jgi:hypothetical protein